MTRHSVQPSDADTAPKQHAPTQPRAEAEAPTKTQPHGGARPAFDADTPSPEVEPIYLLRSARPTAASQATTPTTGDSPGSSSVAAPRSQEGDAGPAAAATNALGLDADALADVVSRALAEALYQSMRPVVAAAIQSAQKEHEKQGPAKEGPAKQGPAKPAAAVKTDAPTSPVEEPASEPLRDRNKLDGPTRGRTRHVSDANARAWARQLAPRRGRNASARSS